MKILFALFLSTLFVGCSTVPSGKFSSFSTATDTLSKSVTVTFQQIRTAEVQNTVVSAPSGEVTEATFQPPKAKNAAGKSVVLIYDYMDIMSNRVDVLDKYANALEALAGSGSADNIDKASSSLAESLNSLSKNDPTISISGGNIVAVLADAAAKWATYNQRKSALIDVLKKGQPAIIAIATEISADTPKLILYVTNYEKNYLAYASEVHKTSKTFTADRFNFDGQVAQQLAAFDSIKTSLQGISASAEKLPAANQDLLNSVSLEGENYDNLKAFVQEARQLRSFYTSLPTK